MTVRVEQNRFAERCIFAALVALLVFAPLPFGSDQAWAASLIAMVVGLLLFAWGVFAALSRDHQPASLRPILPAIALFVLVIVWEEWA